MSVCHWDLHKRKRTGGKKVPYREKRAYEMGSPPTETKLGEPMLKVERSRGGGIKLKLLSCNYANVIDPTSNKAQKVEILKVVKNPSNRNYDKRGIITKGAVIETTLGRAVVTSRPGQDGVINAVLIKQ